MIGAGGAFCFRIDCKIKAHLENKVSFPVSDATAVVVIQRSTPFTAFREPLLAWDRIPVKIWGDWEAKSLGLQDWRKEFQAVDCGADGLVSAEDVKAATQFIDKADLFRTPSKRKSAFDQAGPFGDDWEFVPHGRMMPSPSEDSVDYGVKLGSLTREFLTKTLTTVESSVISMGNALEEVARVTLKRFEGNEKDAMLMAGVIQTLKSNIGSMPVDSNEKFDSPTLWGTTSLVVDEVNRVGASLVELEEEMRPFKQLMEDGNKVFSPAEAKRTTDHLFDVLTKVVGKMTLLSPEFAAMKESVTRLNTESLEWEKRMKGIESSGSAPAKKKVRYGSKSDDMDELMRKLDDNSIDHEKDDVKVNVISPEVQRRLGKVEEEVTMLTLSGIRFDSLEEEMAKLQARIRAGGVERPESSASAGRQGVLEERMLSMESELEALKTAGDVSAIKFGSLGFRNVNDCHEWAIKNLPEGRYGLITDPLFMLERICGAVESQSSAGGIWKKMESRLKLDIRTGSEASALESLACPRPRLFHHGNPSMMYLKNTSRLNQLMKHSSWKLGGGGVGEHITNHLSSLNLTLLQDINHALGGGKYPEAHLIATLCLTATVTSLTQLVGAVDAIFDKLRVQFKDEAAWSLTMQVLDKICEELYVPKDGVMHAMTLGDSESIQAHVLYASFRSHDVIARYVELQFQNHPSVTTEFTRFLATNLGSDKLSDALAKTTADTVRALTKADTASSKVALMEEKLAAALRRITALESPNNRAARNG